MLLKFCKIMLPTSIIKHDVGVTRSVIREGRRGWIQEEEGGHSWGESNADESAGSDGISRGCIVVSRGEITSICEFYQNTVYSTHID